MKNNKLKKILGLGGAMAIVMLTSIVIIKNSDSTIKPEKIDKIDKVMAAEALQDEDIQQLLQKNMIENMKLYLQSVEKAEELFSEEMVNSIAKAVSEQVIQKDEISISREEISQIVLEYIEKENMTEKNTVEKKTPIDQSVIDSIIQQVNMQMQTSTMTENEIKTLISTEVKTVVESAGISKNNLQYAKPGEDGKDGYTPVKGKDYFTESDIKIIVKEVTNFIEQSSGGMLSADKDQLVDEIKDSILSDENIFIAAKDGKDGEDGYTPVKGEDYFTTSEIDSIISQAASSALEKMNEQEQGKEPGMTNEQTQILIEASIASVKSAAEQNGIKLAELETTINSVETRVTGLEDMVNQITGDTSVSERLGSLEGKMEEVKSDVETIYDNMFTIEKEMGTQQERLTEVEDQLEQLPNIIYEYDGTKNKITITNNNK